MEALFRPAHSGQADREGVSCHGLQKNRIWSMKEKMKAGKTKLRRVGGKEKFPFERILRIITHTSQLQAAKYELYIIRNKRFIGFD